MKQALMAASILAAMGLTGNAAAHTQSGALGIAAGAADLYQVLCENGTSNLQSHVKDAAPVAAPLVSVQTIKDKIATNSTDLVDGDAVYSPLVSNPGGEGTYYVSVNKTRSGTEAYSLEFHCMSSAGAHTETTIITIQNK